MKKELLAKYPVIDFLKKLILYIYCLPLKLDRNDFEEIWRQKYKKKLIKYIKFNLIENNTNISVQKKEYVFVCWLQGYDNAPSIVKKCIDSIEIHMDNEIDDVILITKQNINQYVEMPEFILNKWKSGNISDAHFSDILRVFLLCKYGGTWIDATVMLFDEIPEYLLNEELFFFQTSFLQSKNPEISNWFIHSKHPNNPLLCDLRDALINYWKENKKAPDYYMFHDFVSLLANSNRYKEYWEHMKYFNNIAPHTLQKELQNKFDKDRLKEIINMSPIQKLTYKIDDTISSDTFYDYLLGKCEK